MIPILRTSRWRARLAVLLAVLAASLAGLVATAPAAQAAHTSCPALAICGWDGAAWDGSPSYYWTITSWGGGCINIGPSWNDQFDSLKDNMSGLGYVIAYADANCSGATITTLQSSNAYPNNRLGNCRETYNPWGPTCFNDGAGYMMSSIWFYRY